MMVRATAATVAALLMGVVVMAAPAHALPVHVDEGPRWSTRTQPRPALPAVPRGRQSAPNRALADTVHQGDGGDYGDVCDDAQGAVLDLSQTGLYAEDGAIVFTVEGCRAWDMDDLGAGNVEWGLWRARADGAYPTLPDYIAYLFTSEEGPTLGVWRTVTDDSSTWVLLGSTPAEALDRWTWGAALPLTAVEGTGDFWFVVKSVDGAGRTDLLPDAGASAPRFPDACGYLSSRATLRAEPGEYEQTLARARAAGLDVALAVPALGIVEVRSISDATLASVRRWSNIADARRVRPFKASRQAGVPGQAGGTDPRFAQQWGLEQIRAVQAWQVRSGSSLTVAVIDTGVDGQRADLAGRVLEGLDTTTNSVLRAGAASDWGKHGTAVAGVIAAAVGNDVDLAGVDASARVVPYRALDLAGCGSDTHVAAALVDAADRGVDVVNMSLGFPLSALTGSVLHEAVRYAHDLGVVLVAAAANWQELGNETAYPAAYPEVVAVGATTPTRGIAAYSNTGAYVDLVAPGGDGSGTAAGDVLVLHGREQIAAMPGTSFAAPHAAGAALLYLAGEPHATPQQVAEALTGTAVDLGTPGRDDTFGHGLLDVAALLGADTSDAGAPTTAAENVGRLDVDDAVSAGILVSQHRFDDDGAEHVVLSRDDVFADSLAGAPLTDTGPLLFTDRAHLTGATASELERVLPPGATVYLLGNGSAISPDVERTLHEAGYDAVRLGGPSRVETSVAVAAEVHRRHPGTTAVIARAFSAGEPTAAWADSVTGGAWATAVSAPVLVTASDHLHPAIDEALWDMGMTETVLLGGRGALSEAVEHALPAPMRVAGPDRAASAAAIADTLWEASSEFIVIPGYRADGWAFGLAAGGLAADFGVPLLLGDTDRLPAATLETLEGGCAVGALFVLLVGSSDVLGDATAAQAADAC